MTPEGATGPGCAWSIGFGLGAAACLLLLEGGYVGIGFGLATLALIAWKGPRAIATAGWVTGLGGLLTLLYARVFLSCSGGSRSACDPGDIGIWTAAAAAVLVLGVIGSLALALRARAR